MKRARRGTLQEDLRRHAKRLCEPFMRDGKLTSPKERYAEGDNTVILQELTSRLVASETLDAVRAADAGGTDAIPIFNTDMALEGAHEGGSPGNHYGD